MEARIRTASKKCVSHETRSEIVSVMATTAAALLENVLSKFWRKAGELFVELAKFRFLFRWKRDAIAREALVSLFENRLLFFRKMTLISVVNRLNASKECFVEKDVV